jgi:hypothetical protein
MDQGFKVSALAGGAISLKTPITLNCPALAEMDRWVVERVLPAARERFGQDVAALTSVGGYACRGMNNQPGAKLSEHAFGNAFDIGGFQLADGRTITVKTHWRRGDPQEQAFLRDIYSDGCAEFSTALAPGAAFHEDHIHLDLAKHGSTSTGPRRVCNPKPQQDRMPLPTRKDGLPDAPEIEDEIDMAQGPESLSGPGGANLALAAPPAPRMRPPANVTGFAAKAPMTLPTSRRVTSGALREDGAFDPDEEEATSSIRRMPAAATTPSIRAHAAKTAKHGDPSKRALAKGAAKPPSPQQTKTSKPTRRIAEARAQAAKPQHRRVPTQ